MRLATSAQLIETHGLGGALERWPRPVGFERPSDVIKDPTLDRIEKRAVLAAWASDASRVRDEPGSRWLLGTPEPVSLIDVREALAMLDCWDAVQRRSTAGERQS